MRAGEDRQRKGRLREEADQQARNEVKSLKLQVAELRTELAEARCKRWLCYWRYAGLRLQSI